MLKIFKNNNEGGNSSEEEIHHGNENKFIVCKCDFENENREARNYCHVTENYCPAFFDKSRFNTCLEGRRRSI